jgi:xanthine dehydrogenase YagT iron-sulfur-binding subunit
MMDEIARGIPSAVTGDLNSVGIDPSHDELRERMSGNLCRCGAHNGIMDSIESVLGVAS